MNGLRALLLAVAVVAFLTATAAGLPGSVGPATAADTCDGVWVVVDARDAGGSISTRCSPGDPSTGIRALQGAGHGVTYVPGQPGFVCTIDARPDPCNGAPANAHWSYWHATAGGSWTYSNSGAGNRDPAPGTVEGWRFGGGSNPPSTAPPAAPTPPPAPEPTTPPEPPAPTPPASSGSTSTARTPAAPEKEPARPRSDDTGDSDRDVAADEPDRPTDADPDDGPVDDGAENRDQDRDDDGDDADRSGGADPGEHDTAGRPEVVDEDDLGDDAERTGAAQEPEQLTEAEDAAPTTDALDGVAARQESPAPGRGPPLGLIVAGLLVGAIAGTSMYRRRRAVD